METEKMDVARVLEEKIKGLVCSGLQIRKMDHIVEVRTINPDYPKIKRALLPAGYRLMIELDDWNGEPAFFYEMVLEIERFFRDLFDENENKYDEIADMIEEVETVNSEEGKKTVLTILTNFRGILIELIVSSDVELALVYKLGDKIRVVIGKTQIDKKSAVQALKVLAKIAKQQKRKN